MKKVDYTGKCGTCIHFERNKGLRSSWCHKNPYDDSVVHDPRHPYRAVMMSNSCSGFFDVRHTNADEIRYMSDEELAEALSDFQSWGGGLSPDVWLEWLQQPVEPKRAKN